MIEYLSNAKLLEYSQKLKGIMYSKDEINNLINAQDTKFETAIQNQAITIEKAFVDIYAEENTETLVIATGVAPADLTSEEELT